MQNLSNLLKKKILSNKLSTFEASANWRINRMVGVVNCGFFLHVYLKQSETEIVNRFLSAFSLTIVTTQLTYALYCYSHYSFKNGYFSISLIFFSSRVFSILRMFSFEYCSVLCSIIRSTFSSSEHRVRLFFSKKDAVNLSQIY